MQNRHGRNGLSNIEISVRRKRGDGLAINIYRDGADPLFLRRLGAVRMSAWDQRTATSGEALKGSAMTDLERVRDALGRGGLSGHSGCEGGPYLKLHYDTVAEAYRAFEALSRLLNQRAEWAPGSANAPQTKAIAALIAKHVRLEWHGHDHADINFRSMMIAAEAIHAAFFQPPPAGEEPTGSTSAPYPAGTNR